MSALCLLPPPLPLASPPTLACGLNPGLACHWSGQTPSPGAVSLWHPLPILAATCHWPCFHPTNSNSYRKEFIFPFLGSSFLVPFLSLSSPCHRHNRCLDAVFQNQNPNQSKTKPINKATTIILQPAAGSVCLIKG